MDLHPNQNVHGNTAASSSSTSAISSNDEVLSSGTTTVLLPPQEPEVLLSIQAQNVAQPAPQNLPRGLPSHPSHGLGMPIPNNAGMPTFPMSNPMMYQSAQQLFNFPLSSPVAPRLLGLGIIPPGLNSRPTYSIPLNSNPAALPRTAMHGDMQMDDRSLDAGRNALLASRIKKRMDERRPGDIDPKGVVDLDPHALGKNRSFNVDGIEMSGDMVDGFRIIAGDQPESGDEGDMDDYAERRARRRRESEINYGSPAKRGVGMEAIKDALRHHGGRTTGINIVQWIIKNKPDLLELFQGDRTKLRYSIIGTLSAKSNRRIFNKDVSYRNGVKRSEWVLAEDDRSSPIHFSRPEPRHHTRQAQVATNIAQERLGSAGAPAEDQPVAEKMPSASEEPAGASEETKAAETAVVTDESSGKAEIPAAPATGSHGPEVLDETDPYVRKMCALCGLGTDDDQLLLCDHCDEGYHMYCLDPPLTEIPKGEWFCEFCQDEIRAEPEEDSVSESELTSSDDEDDLEELAESENLEDEESNPAACSKHRKWKKRCPVDCPQRALDEKRAAEKAAGPPKRGRGRPRKIRPEEGKTAAPAPVNAAAPSSTAEVATYVDMIEEAIKHLGGEATAPDISTYIETNHPDLLVNKTKTWRNSVSGSLSTHFERVGKDKDGRLLWKIQEDGGRRRSRRESTENDHSLRTRKRRVVHDDDEDDDDEISKPRRKKGKPGRKKSTDSGSNLRVPPNSTKKIYDPERMERLRESENLGEPKANFDGIKNINARNPIEVLPERLTHPGAIFDMCFSTDGQILATVSDFGLIKLWNVNDWSLVREIRDAEETNVDQFYAVQFSKDGKHVITGGKLKDSQRYNEGIQDEEPLPPPIKVFNIESGKVVLRLEGHKDDIVSIKRVTFDGKQYILSASKNAQLIKWRVADDYSELLDKALIADHATTRHHGEIAFLPNYGNKFFIAACDSGLKIYDFEAQQLIQNFPRLYELSDSVIFVQPDEVQGQSNDLFILSRGLELVDEQTGEAQVPNRCKLHHLVVPENGRGRFRLEQLATFTNKDFRSNVSMLKISSNGRYLLAPTTDGKVFIWNLRTAELVGILHEHEDREVRSVLFHPTKKLLLSCGDDSSVRIFVPSVTDAELMQDVEMPPADSNTFESHDAEEEEEAKSKRKLIRGACDFHKNQHLRCPADCPNRKAEVPNKTAEDSLETL
eukprot:TRINITY_DN2644_c0_g1_i2.p1 TRINITY_DN2644_c0_g1~~TRINITY_DN2644_c0_g1_i2.p1  ORF type:complete len:1202 (+),score=337.29 TRINITY_DN2644_c0_g1_i2:134-3739(+)